MSSLDDVVNVVAGGVVGCVVDGKVVVGGRVVVGGGGLLSSGSV